MWGTSASHPSKPSWTKPSSESGSAPSCWTDLLLYASLPYVGPAQFAFCCPKACCFNLPQDCCKRTHFLQQRRCCLLLFSAVGAHQSGQKVIAVVAVLPLPSCPGPGLHALVGNDTVCWCCSHPFLYFPTFFLMKSIVEQWPHPVQHAYDKWRNEIWTSCKALWMLWVPAQIANFAFVPRYLRVPFGEAC